MEHIRVQLSERAYDIEIGSQNLPRTGGFLASGDVSHAVVVTDENVGALYARKVADSIAKSNISVDYFAVAAGETSKSIETVYTIWEELLETGADRKTVLVAVGGGVIGDLAGFIASTYFRGIRFFQVPTTLLAQVDSSVGGKVGINLPNGKNVIGAFHQPIGVLIDTDVLKTLDEPQYLCGLGEILKYAVSLDVGLLTYLEENAEKICQRDESVLTFIIARCCRLKAAIVQRDEKETTGLRALLNYGHTFAHAFETLAGYGNLLHGQAVALGMIYAAKLAHQLGRVDAGWVERMYKLNEMLNLPTSLQQDFAAEQIIEVMQKDKKSEHGNLRFVLPIDWGSCELVGNVDKNTLSKVF